MMLQNKVRIKGTGSYTPPKIVTNEELAKKVDTDPDWIYNTLGIKQRRICEENEYTSDISAKAGLDAIRNAGINKNDIDLIIVATSTPDRKAPSTACITKHKMEINNHCPAFDLTAVCSGFMYAMSLASNMILSSDYKQVLIIGSDTFSKITDWNRRDCVFFGDGAAAVVLEKSNYEDALFDSLIYSECSNPNHFTVFPEDDYFTMNGKAVYQTATEVLPEAIFNILNKNDISLDEVDHIIPHQPSIGILKRTAEILDIPFEKFKTNMHNYANTSGATIPLLLDEVNKDQQFKKDDIVVFASVGSGWTWGAGVYRWH